ncbi:hypothetical protein OH76DRAFT_1478375 [Lentinus brumalis]|uniref:Protein kinase domain-containing protein n=1 Tax=Lentinus brumalis TaxID=2498619 RepID=A0A371DQP6_9APHY|nr:hypothetical protein OH76DRAFT_1478375 [Polyporus brumalis]
MPTLFRDDIGGLMDHELWWHNHYDWFQECGYTLRSRYQADWVPSWKGSPRWYAHLISPDGIAMWSPFVLDATRNCDGEPVALKRVHRSVHPYEVDIGRYLCSPALSSDKRNHCCPVLEVLQDPTDADIQIIVMPFLRKFYDPKFVTIGEAIDFFRQAFEGLQFMHEHHVAHRYRRLPRLSTASDKFPRDCMRLNIMYDPRPMFPEPYHPMFTDKSLDFKRSVSHYSRTKRPCRYYWTDFGLSRQYEPDDVHPEENIILGGDRTVPEFKDEHVFTHNPYHTDLYYLGNLIREDFLQKYSNLEFMYHLIARMIKPKPEQRPTMDEAVRMLDAVISKLPWWKLRARLRRRKDDVVLHFLKDVGHTFRTASYLLLRIPAVPVGPDTVETVVRYKKVDLPHA